MGRAGEVKPADSAGETLGLMPCAEAGRLTTRASHPSLLHTVDQITR
jgi:hypothetical protein